MNAAGTTGFHGASATVIGDAEVIDLAAHRRRRSTLARRATRRPRTLILRAVIEGANPPAVRQIGINDSLPVADLLSALGIAFGATVDAPWLQDPGVGPNDCIHTVLPTTGATVYCHWGLWQVTVTAVDTYPRDAGTPQALCIGGSGDFFGVEFDTALINARLTGDDVTTQVLNATHPDVVDIIERSGIFDFVSLMQALGIPEAHATKLGRSRTATACRSVGARAEDPGQLARPAGVPHHPSTARDAAWVTLLSAACLGDGETTGDIFAATMDSLGWGPMSLQEGIDLAPGIGDVLERIDASAPVDRIVLFQRLFLRP
ncbi:hypothetical protein [Corynebacterium aquilae]|uniref:hypothetical protein n=1 Tax=Corynebacterium aquilae TaxID=203263 RepID=UPI000A00BA19|nr:hypothetical protein [Corynebacterium aquilae]